MTIFRFQVLSWAFIILILISPNRATAIINVNFHSPSPGANWIVGKQQSLSWKISPGSSDDESFAFGIYLEQDLLPDRGNTSIAPKYNASSEVTIYGIIYLFYMLLFSIMLSYMLLYIKAD